jgi:hypothetical protein
VIELIEGLPDEVVGFEAVGEVTAEDYGLVVSPAVKRALAAHERIRLLHVLGERLENHTASGLWGDAKLGLHVRSYERIAVVTDFEHFRALVRAAGRALPVDVRLFSTAERVGAEAWVSEGLEVESSGLPG